MAVYSRSQHVHANGHSGSNIPIFIPIDTIADRDWQRSSSLLFNSSLIVETKLKAAYENREISRAQDHEDVWAFENWFWGMERGVILESGALDGIEFSTSLFFEKHARWTSIHVEANFDQFARLRKNRQGTKVEIDRKHIIDGEERSRK